jgi:hypothetical protein
MSHAEDRAPNNPVTLARVGSVPLVRHFSMQLKLLDSITSRKHERPVASESNRARLISIYMHCAGLSLAEANAKFKRENRKAWARACA